MRAVAAKLRDLLNTLGYMKTQRNTRQRSFRLASDVIELLDERADEYGESANRLAEQILREGLRTRDHPLIFFRGRTGDDRRPGLVGTRLHVSQVIATVRASGGSIDEAAEYFRLSPAQISACVSYYGEFKEEVDALAKRDAEFAARAEARSRREQEILG